MRNLSLSVSFYLAWIRILLCVSSTYATSIARHPNGDLRSYYTRSHSLGEDYKFDPREWETVNITDLEYKYSKPPKEKRSRENPPNAAIGGKVSHAISAVWNGLRGIGNSAETVIITWYTGHDLQNPSCWENTKWAPTDDSMACALTSNGWASKPKCFKFLELCHDSDKCVFVRVIDSCAGCKENSKHVDLTKRAFSQLANLDEGILNVRMRPATEPEAWFEDLWGPKV